MTAEAVFFTHGLYGEPSALARKPTINLWHGSGMKGGGAAFPLRTQRSRPSDLLIGQSEVWAGRLAKLSGLSDRQLVLSGQPRCDQLFHPCTTEELERLGLGCRPFVVWMPTFRASSGTVTSPGWRDSGSRECDRAISREFATAVEQLSQYGLKVVVKPHPLDAEARSCSGAIMIDDAALEAAGIPLYRLLGASSGLITDASAVWTDYLLTNLPIGFFFPDLEAFRNARGFFPPDIIDWLPGPFLEGPDVHEFARDVLDGGAHGRARRQHAAERVGLVVTKTAADDMLDALTGKLAGTHFAGKLAPRPDEVQAQDPESDQGGGTAESDAEASGLLPSGDGLKAGLAERE